MKLYISILFLVFIHFSTSLYSQSPPTITSFIPTSGPIGTEVTITGTNFDTTSGNNIVFFGATQATVSAATATQLTVAVPSGASYQPITVLVNGLIAYSASPFVVTFTGRGTIDANSFAIKQDYTTGSPRAVAIGDLDGDGKADLVAANNGDNTVSILRNTSTAVGTISYAARQDYTTGSGPRSIAIGDLNGDGKADLAVANMVSNTVSVFRNTSTAGGTISYAARQDYTTGTAPFSVAIGDLDGDGKADLAVANLGSNTVSIFRNTSAGVGTISYAAKQDYTTGTRPWSVAIGDLDGDGKTDLAVANESSNTVSVFKNTSTAVGTISYAAKQDYTTGVTTPLSVAIGDLDGDGKADLAVANYGSNTVSIFRNTSTAVGTMSYASGQKTGSGPISIAIGDLDGDGKVDLAVINESSATVSVFRNTSTAVGTISYAAKQDYTTGTEPYSAAIGDLDGDGKADLAVANASSYTVSVFRNLNGIEESIIGTLQNQIVQLSGGSGTDQRNYSIISFPFKNPSVNTLLEELGPYDNSQWRLFRYNGSNREYSVNFGNINSGEGYWFIQRESNNIEMGGESVDITEGSYKMDLVSGFNLIGNPFVWTLNWGEVIDYNVEKGTISLDDFESDYQTSVYAWRTSWRLSSNLEKFEGGFIKTTRAISNFEIPLSALNNAGGRIANELPQKKDIDIDDERWKLNFHIYSPSYDYHLGGIGLSPSASDQKDIWDGSTLPRFIEYLEVDFGDGITRSMKHLDENKSWSFKLPNNLNESSIHLTWDQPISSVNTIILVDSKSRHIFDLSSSRGINISNDPSIVYYLYFGKKESILDQLNLPFDVMHEIYPNPTENKLNIRLYASDHKVGTLKMIGMDGKEILNYSINLEKGMNNHQIRLEELQIPEGIYYLNINNRISTKLIKK